MMKTENLMMIFHFQSILFFGSLAPSTNQSAGNSSPQKQIKCTNSRTLTCILIIAHCPHGIYFVSQYVYYLRNSLILLLPHLSRLYMYIFQQQQQQKQAHKRKSVRVLLFNATVASDKFLTI